MDCIVHAHAAELITRCAETSKTIATAESCTGGLISAALTDISGSSAVFGYGFITYANDAKIELLGVPETILADHGAVSAPVARAMAIGARKRAASNLSIAVTGIAGPGGGSPDKPVGLVYIAVTHDAVTRVHRHLFSGVSRPVIRLQTVRAALGHLLAEI